MTPPLMATERLDGATAPTLLVNVDEKTPRDDDEPEWLTKEPFVLAEDSNASLARSLSVKSSSCSSAEGDVESPPTVEEEEEGVNRGPSNERLLLITFASFMSFALVQLAFAFIAGSQAMKGDSAAMIVDAMTYLGNWIAERRKKRFDLIYPPTPGESELVRERKRRKMMLRLETIPPIVSVSTLLAVTIIVLNSAISALVDYTSVAEGMSPDLRLMLVFSSVNLALDFVNAFCFARAKHLLGYRTKGDRHNHQPAVEEDQSDNSAPSLPPTNVDSDDSKLHEANLNMCSAYSHVFADTVRSVAVIVAAGVAMGIPSVSPLLADSSTAIVVSALILVSLAPLFQGLCQSLYELWSLSRHAVEEDNSPC